MRRKKKWRTKLYVSGVIQGRLLRRLAWYWLLYPVALLHLLFVCDEVLGQGDLFAIGDRYLSFLQSHMFLLICSLTIFPVVLRDMLKMSNRIAGPFVRFERALREMTRGQLVSKVVPRPDDLVHEFAAVFNEAVDYHNRQVDAASREALVESDSAGDRAAVSPSTVPDSPEPVAEMAGSAT
jgi:hypothetical protein